MKRPDLHCGLKRPDLSAGRFNPDFVKALKQYVAEHPEIVKYYGSGVQHIVWPSEPVDAKAWEEEKKAERAAEEAEKIENKRKEIEAIVGKTRRKIESGALAGEHSIVVDAPINFVFESLIESHLNQRNFVYPFHEPDAEAGSKDHYVAICDELGHNNIRRIRKLTVINREEKYKIENSICAPDVTDCDFPDLVFLSEIKSFDYSIRLVELNKCKTQISVNTQLNMPDVKILSFQQLQWKLLFELFDKFMPEKLGIIKFSLERDYNSLINHARSDAAAQAFENLRKECRARHTKIWALDRFRLL